LKRGRRAARRHAVIEERYDDGIITGNKETPVTDVKYQYVWGQRYIDAAGNMTKSPMPGDENETDGAGTGIKGSVPETPKLEPSGEGCRERDDGGRVPLGRPAPAGGGFIFSVAHNMAPGTPEENVVAVTQVL